MAELFIYKFSKIFYIYLPPFGGPNALFRKGSTMDSGSISTDANINFARMGQNPYPGRGFVMGTRKTGSKDGQSMVIVYWIMGRRQNSRNRIFERDGDRVYTVAADPSKLEDPTNIIYSAMNTVKGEGILPIHIVSNGVHTDAVASSCDSNETALSYAFLDSLHAFDYEDDAPNWTPRITGVCQAFSADSAVFNLAILRKSPWGRDCERVFYKYWNIPPGVGVCLTTYAGDGDPLPPFRGEPLIMPIIGDIDGIAGAYWAMLNKENRVSLVVAEFPMSGGEADYRIVNKNTKVQTA